MGSPVNFSATVWASDTLSRFMLIGSPPTLSFLARL
nr:MAG TPA: hypothetical protein [Caudoviricetes sp.]